jgi:hypothetical protein
MVFGKASLAIVTLENGKIAKLMDMESIRGRMVTDMRENGRTVSKMGKAQTFLQMEIHSMASTNWGNQMGTVNINGRMVQYISANSKMVSRMGKASGRNHKHRQLRIATVTMESTRQIKRTGSVCSNGKAEIFTEALIETMKEKALVRCTGLMAVSIKASGNEESSMAKARCSSLTVQLKKDTLRIIFLKEERNKEQQFITILEEALICHQIDHLSQAIISEVIFKVEELAMVADKKHLLVIE